MSTWQEYLCKNLSGLSLVALVVAGRGIAQTPGASPVRLTVRPHEMATGTQNPAAGEYLLDSLDDYRVYVPQPCAGARRCPLVVYLHGGGKSSSNSIFRLSPVADRYGMIMLAPTAARNGNWAQYRDSATVGSPSLEPDRRNIDAALKQVLRRFAIDPDKLAIIGDCNGGAPAVFLGGGNQDVFSRLVTISGWGSAEQAQYVDPSRPNQGIEILLDNEFRFPQAMLEGARRMRRGGHRVTVALQLRDHGYWPEDFDYVGRWLHEGWSAPTPATRSPSLLSDSLPLLTPEAIVRMTAFWKIFKPDSGEEDLLSALDDHMARQRGNGLITLDERLPHLREVVLPLGTADERPSTWMMDMSAVAARYPAVTAALKEAGLTAHQHDAYRLALITAMVAEAAGELAGTIDATSILGKNLAFVGEHSDEIEALAPMFGTP